MTLIWDRCRGRKMRGVGVRGDGGVWSKERKGGNDVNYILM